jgi:hypothetical protein
VVGGASGEARDSAACHVRFTCGGLPRGKSGPRVVNIDVSMLIDGSESILVDLLLLLTPCGIVMSFVTALWSLPGRSTFTFTRIYLLDAFVNFQILVGCDTYSCKNIRGPLASSVHEIASILVRGSLKPCARPR